MTWKQRAPGVFEGIPGEQKDEELEFLAKMSNIPPSTFETHRLSTWQHRDASDKKAWLTVCEWATGAINHPFLTFLGQPGVGKTHLSLALGWEWLERGKTVLYYHVAGLLNDLRDGYRQSGASDYAHILAYAQNCSLLILDDLGTEKETEWATEQLDFIIDYRYENRKPLIVTTNLTLDDLLPRIADRLKEGTITLLKGESFRKQKRGKEVNTRDKLQRHQDK